MDTWQDRLDSRWKQLPAPEKRRIVLYSFAGYLLVTLAVVVQVIYEVGNTREEVEIEHISTPVARQDAAGNTEVKIQEFKREDNEGEQERESKLSGQ